jgi:hypothetical protein
LAKPADLLVQLAIGDECADVRIVAFPDDRGLVAARRQMPVEAVDRGVQRAVLEPFDRDFSVCSFN